MTSNLNILSIPEGADIYIDGMDIDLITPTLTPLILEAGTHNYLLTLTNYESIYGTITLIDGETHTLIVSLASNMNKLYEKFVIIGAIALGVSVIALFKHEK